MDKIKKLWKELSVFGIVLVCILGLYIYRLMVTAEATTISQDKFIDMVENDKSFVIYTGTSNSSNTATYQTTVETYLKKNRSAKIYYLDVANLEDSDHFMETYFAASGADTANPHTYVFINGELTKTEDGAIGYYTLDKVMNEFNENK